jgi:transposase InsO family protein
MSWKEIVCVVRRLKFVKLALKAQQSMSQLCRVFGISRKTGYQWKERFEREGGPGLRDRSSRPHRSPRQTSWVWVKRIRKMRRRHRSWGSRKLAARLRQTHGTQAPAARTIGDWLKRLKLSRAGPRRSRRGPKLRRPALTVPRRSNQVWTVDFKGWFRTQDGQRVEPLTVRDLFSRYVLSIRLLSDQSWKPVRRVFLGLFARYGYPKIIRVDNGGPFGSNGPAGLSRLSSWWSALGIQVQFIAPGHPEQNGAHEQMHRVLKAETTKPTSRNLRSQQRRINRWIKTYNQIRPHEGLKQRPPGEVYRWKRARPRSAALRYPKNWQVRRVRSNGQIRWRGRKRFVGEAFVGYPVGLCQASQSRWVLRFARLVIGELWEGDAGGMRPAKYPRRPGDA